MRTLVDADFRRMELVALSMARTLTQWAAEQAVYARRVRRMVIRVRRKLRMRLAFKYPLRTPRRFQ